MPEEKSNSLPRKWLDGLRKIREPEPAGLNIGESKPLPQSPPSMKSAAKPAVHAPTPVGPDAAIQHCSIYFTRPDDGSVFLGHPVQFLPGQRHPSIAPGSRDLQGVPGIWANDLKLGGNAVWVDDPHKGLFCGTVTAIEQVLGCKGTIGGVPYVFAEILQI